MAATVTLDDPLLRAQWFAVAWSTELIAGRPLARTLLGLDLVLWRSGDAVHCWRDLCIHRGAKLSLGHIADDCLHCPYHGWQYDTAGLCVRIPAQPDTPPPLKARAEAFLATERYGMVWVRIDCAADPGQPPAFPFGDEPGFRLLCAGPYRFRALGPRVMENFFDVAHLGVVHAGLLGDPQHVEMEEYKVEQTPLGPRASNIRIWQPDPDGTGQPALVTYSYWASAPLTGGLEKLHNNQRFAILLQVAPIDAEFSEARMVIAMDYSHDVPADEIVRFQDTVALQDKAVVESQRPELLPLDLQQELHLRSDRMAIAYRKWLRDLGFTYGTA